MTTKPQSLDTILETFAIATHEVKAGEDETPNFEVAKQAILRWVDEVVINTPHKNGGQVFNDTPDGYIAVTAWDESADKLTRNQLKILKAEGYKDE